jgi:hypothetical protein
MLKLVAALAVVGATASPALALCVSYPDGASTNYVENSTAQTICLQQELAGDTRDAANRVRIEAELDYIQRQMQQQRLLLIEQRALGLFPQLPY